MLSSLEPHGWVTAWTSVISISKMKCLLILQRANANRMIGSFSQKVNIWPKLPHKTSQELRMLSTVLLFIARSLLLLCFEVLNCQKKSTTSRLLLDWRCQCHCLCHCLLHWACIRICICLCHCRCIFFGQIMFSHHSDQMSQRSQFSKIALWRCSLNVFVIVIVIVFVFVIVLFIVFFLVRLCFLNILIKCLKGHNSQRSLFGGVL